ncbi:hypothetical protein SRHO_G00276330 [Serrasalmus rhombeus]
MCPAIKCSTFIQSEAALYAKPGFVDVGYILLTAGAAAISGSWNHLGYLARNYWRADARLPTLNSHTHRSAVTRELAIRPCAHRSHSTRADDRSSGMATPVGVRGGSVQSDASSSPSEHGHMGQSHPAYPVGPQSLLVAQQLASAVSGVMSGGAPGLNQPILIPFNAGGHLGGQQGLVLSLPTAANIQSLVAAAAAGGIMTLPLQNLQAAHHHAPTLPLSLPITATLTESCWHSTSARRPQPSAESPPGLINVSYSDTC